MQPGALLHAPAAARRRCHLILSASAPPSVALCDDLNALGLSRAAARTEPASGLGRRRVAVMGKLLAGGGGAHWGQGAAPMG